MRLAFDLLRQGDVRTMGRLGIVLTGARRLSALHLAFIERTTSNGFRVREFCRQLCHTRRNCRGEIVHASILLPYIVQ